MQTKINTFRDLKVWQTGLLIAKEVYLLTKQLPKEEIFGLISQLRRASVSIPSNIAEGRERNTKKDFCQFLHISLGSLAELETQLYLAKELYKIDIEGVVSLIHEEQRMLVGLIKKLK